VNVIIDDAISHRRNRRRRRRQLQIGDAVLAEFAQRARWELWAKLATSYVRAKRAEARRQRLEIIVAFKAALRVPALRETIPLHLFTHTAICLGISHVAFSMLLGEGILRREGKTMQVWLSPYRLEDHLMKELIRYVRLFKRLGARGEFALRLPMDGGIACSPMSLGTRMTVEDLKGVAAASSGITSKRQRMSHLESELVSGYLVDNGVRPGSCVCVTEIIEV